MINELNADRYIKNSFKITVYSEVVQRLQKFQTEAAAMITLSPRPYVVLEFRVVQFVTGVTENAKPGNITDCIFPAGRFGPSFSKFCNFGTSALQRPPTYAGQFRDLKKSSPC